MPLPQDQRIVDLANDILQQFDTVFGLHPGFRPAHAKGLMLQGTFLPSPGAADLTRAPHIARPSTSVVVRFSNSTGLPLLPDSSPDANPRGMAIRFQLGEHQHTDIIAHSADGFPTQNGQEFLELLRAVAASGPDVPSPKPVEQFVASHPATLAYFQTPRPFPSSLARLTFFGVTAFLFTNAAGEQKAGRYRIVPEEGNDFLSDEEATKLPPNFHFDEIADHVTSRPVRFTVRVQVAPTNVVTDNPTVHWPENSEERDLGTLELTSVLPDSLSGQQHIIFDPIPRIDGIDPSTDPLLELRAAIYLISGRRRRTATMDHPVR